MNPLIADIETRREVCCSTGRFDELAALKPAVEELQWLRDRYVTDEGEPYGLGRDVDDTLRAIAEKLGVKG